MKCNTQVYGIFNNDVASVFIFLKILINYSQEFTLKLFQHIWTNITNP